MTIKKDSTNDQTVLIELCKMWSNAMRMSKDLELDQTEMKKIGDRLLNTQAKTIESVLLKLRAVHSTAQRALPHGHPVRNLLESAVSDLDKLER